MNVRERVCVYIYTCIYICTFYVSFVVLDLDQIIGEREEKEKRENNHLNPTNSRWLIGPHLLGLRMNV
jgi:hypothetical protein